MMEQGRYVRKATSSHTPEEYERRLGKVLDLEHELVLLDFQIARLKDGKTTINHLLKRRRTELDWETYTWVVGEPVIRYKEERDEKV